MDTGDITKSDKSALDAILATLRDTKCEVACNRDGTYTHVFTPPGMTMEDVYRLLARNSEAK